MTRRSSRKPVIALSLFPFLAVLVCTMGALIVLLVCVVQKARIDGNAALAASASADSEPAEDPLAELRMQKEDEEWRRQELEAKRTELQQKLVQQRLTLSHFEDHIRQLEQRWQALKQQAASLQSIQAAKSQEDGGVRRQLDSIASETERLKGALDAARQAAEGRKRAFAIVPYDGPHGTKRRPIYIECTDAGVVLQPEGVTLAPTDFEGSLGAGNPLDASLRTIREYLARYGGGEAGTEPYPLLIVRPNGTIAYAVARAALKSWDDEFGYELVDEEMTLAYPKPDPALKQLIEKSIADARQRQSILAAMMPGRFKSPLASGMVATGMVATTNGGFAPAGGGFPSGGAASGPGHYPPGGPRGEGGANGSFTQVFRESLGASGEGTLTMGGAQRAAAARGQSGTSMAGSNANANSSGNSGPPPLGPPGNPASPGNTKLSSFPTAGTSADPPPPDATAARLGEPRQGGTHQATSSAKRTAATSRGGDAKSSANAKPIAQDRGPEWGLPNRGPNTTGIQRSIAVQCFADRLVLVPEAGDFRGPAVIPLADGVSPAMEGFVAATWKRMETWGIAGDGCYWKPILRVQVAPGAEGQFQEMATLLEGSGLTIERKP